MIKACLVYTNGFQDPAPQNASGTNWWGMEIKETWIKVEIQIPF